jgi:hypothetical protein
MSRGDRAELAGASVSSVYARCSCALFGFAFATAASMCCVFASGSVGERSVYALRVRERSSVGIRERSVCARVFASVVRLAFASAVSVRCVFASAVSVCACSRAQFGWHSRAQCLCARVRERSSVGIRERSVCARVFASAGVYALHVRERSSVVSAVSMRCMFAGAQFGWFS